MELICKKGFGRLKEGITQKSEVSQRRELDAAFGVERILDTVASHFKVSPEDVLEDKKEIRNTTICRIKKWTSMTNRQLGEIILILLSGWQTENL